MTLRNTDHSCTKRRQSLSKQDADLSAINRDSHIFELDQKITDMTEYEDTHIKYIKRTVPALIHLPEGSTSAAWKKPCLIRHRLHPYLSYTLNSPLVSIYHQLEVTFQFGMKYEEIKTRIPIIIASIPRKEPALSTMRSDKETTIMMKYAFEEVARSGFLAFKLESRSSSQPMTDDDFSNAIDDNYSVIRDTNLISPASDDDAGRSGRITPMTALKQNGRLPPAAVPSPSPMKGHQRALSPTPPLNTTYGMKNNRQLKKFASAFDLSISSQESPRVVDYDEPPEERPRTTTPTMRRHNMRKPLQPINVDLANGKALTQNRAPRPQRKPELSAVVPAPPPQTELPAPPPQTKSRALPTSNRLDSSSSDVLPAIDRVHRRKNNPNNSNNNSNNTVTPIYCSISNDDLCSVYSDTTSVSSVNNAPSLSTSATLSTSKSHPTLHSRPPSPVFSPAPGLPATIALRPQQDDVQAIEEMFPPDSAMSPAMNTIASSTILTPRTSQAVRRRIALSTISSLTNDSLQLGPSIMTRGRSSTVDPDVQSMMMHTSPYSSGVSSLDYPPAPINRYAFARLPPIPTNNNSGSSSNAMNTSNTIKGNQRMTKLYMEDSDDEDSVTDECNRARSPQPPPLPELHQASFGIGLNNNNNTPEGEDPSPPRLPRLSFGKDFGISLGI